MKKKGKKISYQKHQERKRKVAGLKVVGIDPAKENEISLRVTQEELWGRC